MLLHYATSVWCIIMPMYNVVLLCLYIIRCKPPRILFVGLSIEREHVLILCLIKPMILTTQKRTNKSFLSLVIDVFWCYLSLN